MENKIGELKNYTIKAKGSDEEAVKKCRFYYLHDDYAWKEFDVEGHYDLESAFELAKNIMVDDVIRIALKEAIRSLDIPSKNFHFTKDGEIEDLRDYTFDEAIFDNNSEIFKAFKKLLVNNWNDDIAWYYFRANAAKNANIHDDVDKKRLYDHYFDSLAEFNDRISFLEYYENYSIDWGESNGTRKIEYDLIKFGDFHCVDNSVTRDELKNYLKLNKIYLMTDDSFLVNTATWGTFAYYYGKNNGLTDIESKSFANVLSEYFTELPFEEFARNSFDTKKHFKEDEIYNTLDEIVCKTIRGNVTNHVKEVFFSLFDIYKNNIQNFEFKSKRLEFRVSQSQYNKFMSLKGKSKSDKLTNLLKYQSEKIDYSILPDIDINKESVKDWGNGKKIIGGSYPSYFPCEWICASIPKLERKYEDYEVNIINSEIGHQTPEVLSIIQDIEYMDSMEEDRKFMEELKEEFENMTPEQLEHEFGIGDQEVEEDRKFMEELKEEFENMTPEQLEHEFEIDDSEKNQKQLEELKKALENKKSKDLD